ncbi:ribosomal protein S30-like isoform X1 [Acyrthosiphon pisum]|uniref:ACYPI002629 protein n=1 Tax=Acyrthosiphon pisum TaxID=7029 RepID=C4WTG7_ACYPI|nr:ribosomal protein S30-like [Acyrthosiphon pisum]XP_008184444.1 ribosomal protein S30-like isoform X1 [Acyrthosiphon pisum]BAH71187.1 ACYPI002629 [Acyrthosiphon pisum]|eukprot:NP_001155487.1 ribosomal protein S30-like [Acyrthosiphon pisum]
MQLFVRGQNVHALECQGFENILQIKSKLAALEDVEENLISLYDQGHPLNDDQIVGELINFNIDFIVPLLGGKVHGSLARAGKVKGQTPKVEKVEKKKKKKTGRSKRRIQYNRRFVNVVQTFGRRRGPNANS